MTGDPGQDNETAASGTFEFAPEAGEDAATTAPAPPPGTPLTVLSVDDDPEFQRSLQFALTNFRFQDRPIRLLTASSATGAAKVLSQTPEVAVIVLDVVMETDDAGLRLVRNVREVQGNAEVRIILVTGQPGVASMQTSLDLLDISDYWLKTELTYERLHGVLTGNLRTWEQIQALSRARRGLQAIVEASNGLNRARDLEDFSAHMIRELSRLLGLAPEGVVCAQEQAQSDPLSARIVGAAGRFASAIAQPLSALQDGQIRDLLVRCLAERTNLDAPGCQVLFFAGGDRGPHAAVYLATPRQLDSTERELLHVFSANVNSGLINVSLASRLDRLAYEDSLLAIPNANALLRALECALDMPQPRGRSLLFVDLDQYTQSCLSLGIEQGDLLLQRMARRLRTVFPPPCLVARLHDDTFAILGQSTQLRPESIDRLESFDPEDPTHPPFISVGAGRLDLDLFQGSGRRALAIGSLLLKRARSQGLSQLVEYFPGMEHETDRRFTRSRELYHALHGNEISIELQPQVELPGGRIVGAEALARWTRPDGSRVPPNEFIPVAEANGLIVPLGRQVIDLACAALARLKAEGFGDIPVAVNVSPLQLARREFTAELLQAVQRHGVAPQRLEIEITESAAMGDYQANGALLRGLREAGFTIAIDDFGTGYSSLGYLRALPVTTLKVDRCFVEEIGRAPEEQTIADMIIGLGRRLGMRVLAEGVETDAQAIWLQARACVHAQGFLFARPEPLEAFLARLRR